MITGLNHITLAVSKLEESLYFYRKLLGFKAHVKWRKGAYLSANNLWLCLSLDTPSTQSEHSRSDYSHIAFSVTPVEFNHVKTRLITNKVKSWKENKSEGESFYFLDPDHHKLELHVGDLQTRLESLKSNPYEDLQWLDTGGNP